MRADGTNDHDVWLYGVKGGGVVSGERTLAVGLPAACGERHGEPMARVNLSGAFKKRRKGKKEKKKKEKLTSPACHRTFTSSHG